MRGIYEISIDKYVYIGQAEVIEKRQREHLASLNRGDHHNVRVQRAFDKHGFDQDGWFCVLELVSKGEALTPREQFWFEARVRERGRERVMNLVEPADNPMNDPEVRERQAAASAVANREKTQNPEWKARTAEGTARRTANPEWRAKNAAKNAEVGRQNAQNPEWKANMVASVVAARAKSYVFRDLDGLRVDVYNLRAFCRENGLNHSSMVLVASGKRRQCSGWTRYEEDTDA